MKCPLCDTEMIITGSGYVVRGGKFYRKISLSCRNRKCGNYKKVVKEDLTELDVVEENSSEAEQGESGE